MLHLFCIFVCCVCSKLDSASLGGCRQATEEARQHAAACERQLDDYRRALEELSARANGESELFERRARHAQDAARDLRRRLRLSEKAIDSARVRERGLARELAQTRKDCKGMLKVMGGMEKQLAEYAANEEHTAALARGSKEKVELAVLERDQAQAREVQARREIARLLEARRAAATEALEAQEAAVVASQA